MASSLPPSLSPDPLEEERLPCLGDGYIDPLTLTEEQLEAAKELETILATTPFSGTRAGRCVELLPGFFLSNGAVAQNVGLLKKHRIGAVLNLAPNEVPTGEDLYAEHEISYCGIDARDELDANIITEHWPQAKGFIEQSMLENRKVLVHCALGVNRSGAMAIAYVSWKTSSDLIETARRIKGRRYQLVTNGNFQRALILFSSANGLLLPSQRLPASTPPDLSISMSGADPWLSMSTSTYYPPAPTPVSTMVLSSTADITTAGFVHDSPPPPSMEDTTTSTTSSSHGASPPAEQDHRSAPGPAVEAGPGLADACGNGGEAGHEDQQAPPLPGGAQHDKKSLAVLYPPDPPPASDNVTRA